MCTGCAKQISHMYLKCPLIVRNKYYIFNTNAYCLNNDTYHICNTHIQWLYNDIYHICNTKIQWLNNDIYHICNTNVHWLTRYPTQTSTKWWRARLPGWWFAPSVPAPSQAGWPWGSRRWTRTRRTAASGLGGWRWVSGPPWTGHLCLEWTPCLRAQEGQPR